MAYDPARQGRRRVALVIVVCVLGISVLPILSNSSTIGIIWHLPFQTGQATAQVNSTQLPRGSYDAIPIRFAAPALISYSTRSNVTITTALMSPAQFSAFKSNGLISGNSVYDQNGTANFNGLMEQAGTYYFVSYALFAPAEVTYNCDYSSNFRVENATTYVGQFISLKPSSGFSLTLHLLTVGSTSSISLFGVSNETVQYSILQRFSGDKIFSSPDVTLTSNASSPGSLTYSLGLQRGIYLLEINNTNPSHGAFAYFSYSLKPQFIDPYLAVLLHGGFDSPNPTGIASFGIRNESGHIVSYKVKTSAVAGLANITSLLAYNASASNVGVYPYAATLQLNSVLVVNDANGSQYVYWPQDVLEFVTNYGVVLYKDNILNLTGDNAPLTNQTITSKNGGYVIGCEPPRCSTAQSYYGIYGSAPMFKYNLPFNLILIMNESVVAGEGVLVRMGVYAMTNGTSLGSPSTFWFDNIMIHEPRAASAYFYISGNESTPIGAESLLPSFYDTELTFGGAGNGETTYFQQLNAVLGLYYYPGTSFVAFPSYYSFGGNTAESADNVFVSYLGNGEAKVTPGTADYAYLGE